MSKISVNLKDYYYEISVAQNSFELFDGSLLPLVKNKTTYIITDSNVDKIYSARLESFLKINSSYLGKYVFTAGEESKNFKTFEFMLRGFVQAGLDRKSCVLALGGGVCGDMAGFAASVYMRGIDYIQIPTTLLAMVDSSVGGKTAIDLPEGKNLIGAFHQPKGVFIDVSCLNTLPVRELSAGLAEVIKYGMIIDKEFFYFLINKVDKIKLRDLTLFSQIISKCCSIKAEIVSRDEKEDSLRAILNFGHTFGHALEMVSGYNKFIHGEAVGIGMLMASELAVNLGCLKRDKLEALGYILGAVGLPIKAGNFMSPELIYSAMYSDKKTKNRKINFIIPDNDIGKVKTVSDVEKDTVLNSIRVYL